MSALPKIRLECPSCKSPLSVSMSLAEKQVACPKCHSLFIVPVPEPTIYADDDSDGEQEGEPLAFLSNPAPSTCPPAHQPHLSQKPLTVQPLLVAGIVVVAAAILFGTILLPSRGGTHSNARCHVCGKEFRISEEYRGNASQAIVKIPCPRCGLMLPAMVLYNNHDDHRGPSRNDESTGNYGGDNWKSLRE